MGRIKNKVKLVIIGVVVVYFLGLFGMAELNKRICDKVELLTMYYYVIKKSIVKHRGIDVERCGSLYITDGNDCEDSDVRTGDICNCNVVVPTVRYSRIDAVLEYVDAIYLFSTLTHRNMSGDIIIYVHDSILSDNAEREVVLDAIRSPGRDIMHYNELLKISEKDRYNHPDFFAAIAFRELHANQKFDVTIIPLSKMSLGNMENGDGLTITVRPKEM